MKTKDIAYGGLMIALFLALGLVFRNNTRVVQTYLEIVKIIIVAVFIRRVRRKNWWIYAMACLLSCLIFVSVSETLIYNVPSIIGGCVIGLQRENVGKVRNYMIFFVVNSIMIVYEFTMYGFFMQTNLFALYSEQLASTLVELTNGMISQMFLQGLFVLFMICDSAFSSLVIYILSQIILKKINGIKTTNDAVGKGKEA